MKNFNLESTNRIRSTIVVEKDVHKFLSILSAKHEKSHFINELVKNSTLYKQYLKEIKDA